MPNGAKHQCLAPYNPRTGMMAYMCTLLSYQTGLQSRFKWPLTGGAESEYCGWCLNSQNVIETPHRGKQSRFKRKEAYQSTATSCEMADLFTRHPRSECNDKVGLESNRVGLLQKPEAVQVQINSFLLCQYGSTENSE